MKLWTMVATWFLFWAVVFVPLTASYKTVYYSADSNDAYTYQAFVTQLRQALQSGTVNNNIPVLPSQLPVTSDERFVLINIDSGGRIPKIAVDVIKANIVAFSVNDKNSYFFRDVSDDIYSSPLFEETTKTRLPFGGSYAGLQVAGARRETTALGTSQLNAAVVQLYNYPSSPTGTNIAPSLLIVMQMVSESAKLAYVENKLVENFIAGFAPRGDVISLEDTWSILSAAIQVSENGEFDPIFLQDEYYNVYSVSTVGSVIGKMGLLLAKDSTESTTTKDLIYKFLSVA